MFLSGTALKTFILLLHDFSYWFFLPGNLECIFHLNLTHIFRFSAMSFMRNH